MRLKKLVQLILLVYTSAAAWATLGCAPPPASEGGFDSPDPASKLYAIQRAGESLDKTAIPKLIEQLESDDPAVRQYASHALQKITGRDFGFRHWQDDAHRRQAVARWIDAYRAGKLAGDQGPHSPADQP